MVRFMSFAPLFVNGQTAQFWFPLFYLSVRKSGIFIRLFDFFKGRFLAYSQGDIKIRHFYISLVIFDIFDTKNSLLQRVSMLLKSDLFLVYLATIALSPTLFCLIYRFFVKMHILI